MTNIFNRFLSVLFRRRKPHLEKDSEEALLNYALHLAQEWGDDWMKPIQERLATSYPDMSQRQLDLLNDLSQEAMHFCYGLARKLYEKTSGGGFADEWNSACLARYPWIDEKNLRQLYSTGRYYATKDSG